MNYKINLTFNPKPKTCTLAIGRGLSRSQTLLDSIRQTRAAKLFIITDKNVADQHSHNFMAFLNKAGLQAELLVFAPGEQHKSRKTKELLEDQMLAHTASRDSLIVAFGGGIVSDVAGFVAATYCRGIPLLLVPTTLLSMVDASIGGKTGVNVPQGKNLIGATYQPAAIIIDSEFLQTLPQDELKNGVVEMFKHGLIADPAYVEFLSTAAKRLLQKDLSVLEEAIYKSCLVKAKVVQEDETEQAKRRLLNFGHTVGHALETATENAISHGKAVAIGIMVESYLSLVLGLLSQADFNAIGTFFDAYGIDLHIHTLLSESRLFELMCLDKKSQKNTPRFVLLKGIGQAAECQGEFCQEVGSENLRKSLNWMCKNYLRTTNA